jgi:DNA-binding winged helix-turn-helix (wHTH) protein
MNSSNSQRVRFGPFEADLETHELWKNGLRVRLGGQPFEILALLLGKPGQLVTRDELQKELWAADTFVDFNHGLNAAVNKLRETLSDSAEEPRYVETLPRRGYRFIGSLEPVPPRAGAIRSSENAAPPIAVRTELQMAPAFIAARTSARKRLPLWAAVVMICVVLAVVSVVFIAVLSKWMVFRERWREAANASARTLQASPVSTLVPDRSQRSGNLAGRKACCVSAQ